VVSRWIEGFQSVKPGWKKKTGNAKRIILREERGDRGPPAGGGKNINNLEHKEGGGGGRLVQYRGKTVAVG